MGWPRFPSCMVVARLWSDESVSAMACGIDIVIDGTLIRMWHTWDRARHAGQGQHVWGSLEGGERWNSMQHGA